MKKNDFNHYSRFFSLIFELYKEQQISLFEKRILKQGIFEEEDNINNFIKEFNESHDEQQLKKNLIKFVKFKDQSSPNQRNKSIKNSRTEIAQPKVDQFSPRLSSDSKLNYLKGFDKAPINKKLENCNSLEINMIKQNENKKNLATVRENDQIMEILNTTYEKLSMSDLRDGRDFQGETFQILKKTLESILKNKGQNSEMEKSLIEKFLKTNTEFLERFKFCFHEIKNAVIDLLTDRLHYVNIFTLIKKMVKNINDADEFAFFCETDGGKWQIYDSYYDKTKILDLEFQEKFQAAIGKISTKDILEITVDEQNIFNMLINNHKYHKIYLLKLFYKTKPYLFSYNWAKSTIKNRFIKTFFESSKCGHLTNLVELLSELIIESIKSITNDYGGNYILEDILEKIFEVNENFMIHSKCIVLNKLSQILQNTFRTHIEFENENDDTFLETAAQMNNCSYQCDQKRVIKSSIFRCAKGERFNDSPIWCPRKYSNGFNKNYPKLKSQNFTTIIDHNKSKFDRKDYNLFEIESLNFKLYYKTEMNNNEFIKNALHAIKIPVLKFFKYVNKELHKSMFYRYFSSEEDKVVMEFDCHGVLKFMSRPLSEKFILENKIIFTPVKNENIYLFNQIFSSVDSLKSKVKELLMKNRWFSRKMSVNEQNVVYEILSNFSHKKNRLRSLFLIIQENSKARGKMKRQTSSRHLDSILSGGVSPNTSKRNLKALFKNSVKTIRSIITLHSLKRTLSLLKGESKNDTYIQEFVPDNLQKESIEDDEFKSKDSEDEIHSSKTSPRDNSKGEGNKVTNIKAKNILKYTISKLSALNKEEIDKNSLKFRGYNTKKLDSSPEILEKFITPDLMTLKKEKDDTLDSFAFNILDESNPLEKQRFVWSMFEKNGFMEEFMIPINTLCDFINIMMIKYNKRSNPFHNFDHGISVMQCCHVFCNKTALKNYFTSLEKFALIFSGLCHDVAHTGHNNVFEMNCLSKLSLRYHDKSVLEQHHLAITFKILLIEKYNIFFNLSVETVREIRKFMISNILSTDMKEHFSLLASFETRMKELMDGKGEFCKKEDDKKLLLGIMIHSADFNGTVKDFSISRIWSEKVNLEFFRQYKEEGLIGLPQTPYMKDLDQIGIMAKAEMGFIKMIVQPLWGLMNIFLDHELEDVIKRLNDNANSWEKIYLESSNDPQKRSFLTTLAQEEGHNENKEDDNAFKRSKSMFSYLKKTILKDKDKEKDKEK